MNLRIIPLVIIFIFNFFVLSTWQISVQSLIILFVLFFLKELTMGIQGLVIIKRTGTTYSAKWYGKISTFLLYASMIILILWQDIPQLATYIIIAVCSISILIALVLYSILNYKKIKQVENEHKN